MVSFDIRHNGRFVVRVSEEDEEQARAQAERQVKALRHLKGVTIEDPKPFELECRDGFIDCFDTEKEANEAMARMKSQHKAHVKRGGPKSLERGRRSRGVTGPLGAVHAAEDPGYVVKDARA